MNLALLPRKIVESNVYCETSGVAGVVLVKRTG